MSRRSLAVVALALGLALLLAQPLVVPWSASASHRAVASSAGSSAVSPAQRAAITSHYGQLPLRFELNAGQDADPAVRFVAQGSGYSLALTPSSALLSVAQPVASPPQSRFALPGQPAATPAVVAPPTVVSMTWLGANPAPVVTGEQPLPGTANYFLGNDPAQWHTNVPTYQQVRLHDVYPGVDLVYYGNAGQLEYDFVVAPGADPSRIALGFTGADRLGVDLQGNLSLSLPGSTIAQQKPLIYQTVNGTRQTIAGGYTLTSSQRVGFALGAYNLRLPLVIDPAYRFSTYLGGSGIDYGYSIAVDGSGNAYVAGPTTSADFPVANPEQLANGGGNDAFVSELNAAGSALVYSTFIGGSGDDYAYGIAVDASGEAYITGQTNSTNFPVGPTFYQGALAGAANAFVTKLNAAGSALVFSTYLGGSGTDGAIGIAVDSGGNAYVTGSATSTNFPTFNGFGTSFQTTNHGNVNAFVSRFSSGGGLSYSTYLGGDLVNEGSGIAVDSGFNAYVTGFTNSTTFPITGGAFQSSNGGGDDAFVTKVNPFGTALAYSTYLGGSGYDQGSGIAVDSGGNAYVTGATLSTNFPTMPFGGASNGGDDAFVTKLNASGSALVYSTYLGGSGNDSSNGIAVDANGEAYVTGKTQSSDFPLANPLQSSLRSPNGNGFVTKLNVAGSLDLFSTYLGGTAAFGDAGFAIAAGSGGNVYVTGVTSASDFPTANALYPTYAGNNDAFVTKIQTLPTPVFTPGVFRPSTATFYLHNANSTGYADISARFGAGTDVPVVGDWTGKGYKTIGIFRNGAWFLRNSNTTGGSDITVNFGTSGDIPVVGDWTGKGYDSIGIFRPSTGTWYLRDSNTGGAPDISIPYGTTGDVPIVGDWTGKGYDSIGVYRPSLGVFFLRNKNTAGGPNLTFFFGALGDAPMVGDWTGKGFDTVGVYRPSTQTFYLRNSNTTGVSDLAVTYGASGDKPLVGLWALLLGSSKPSHHGTPAMPPAAATAPKQRVATAR